MGTNKNYVTYIPQTIFKQIRLFMNILNHRPSSNQYVHLISDIAIFAVGNMLIKVVQFFLLPLYTSAMTTETYGIAEIINNLSEFLFPIITLCIFEALFRFVIDNSDEQYRQNLLSQCFTLFLISFFITVGIGIVLQNFLKHNYIKELLFVLFSYSLRMLFGFFARGCGNTRLYALSGVANAVLLVIFNIILLIHFRLGTRGYLLSLGLSHLFSAFVLYIGCKPCHHMGVRKPNPATIKPMLKYSLPLVGYNAAWWIYMMIGRYILLWFSGTNAVGIYMAVNKLGGIINMFQTAFYYAFQLNASKAAALKNSSHFFTKTYYVYSSSLLIVCSFIITISPILSKMTLKGEFYQAKIYLPLVIFIAFLDCLFIFFRTLYTVYMKTNHAMISAIIGAIANVIVGLLLIPHFNIWGVLISNLICSLIIAAYRIQDTRKFVSIDGNWSTVIPCILIICLQIISLIVGGRFSFLISGGLFFVLLVFISAKFLSNTYCLKNR